MFEKVKSSIQTSLFKLPVHKSEHSLKVRLDKE